MTRYFDVPQGATPITDCSGLIPQWVHTLLDLNRVEAENILKAQKKFLKGSFSNFHPEELRTRLLSKLHSRASACARACARPFLINFFVEPF